MTGYVALCVRACALNARGFTASMHTGGVWVFCCMCAMLQRAAAFMRFVCMCERCAELGDHTLWPLLCADGDNHVVDLHAAKLYGVCGVYVCCSVAVVCWRQVILKYKSSIIINERESDREIEQGTSCHFYRHTT